MTTQLWIFIIAQITLVVLVNSFAFNAFIAQGTKRMILYGVAILFTLCSLGLIWLMC